MRKKVIALILLVFVFAAGTLIKVTLAAGAANPLVPVFSASEKAAALHKDLENRTASLASKADVLSQRGSNYQEAAFNYGAGQLKDGVSGLPEVVKDLGGTMGNLEVELRRTGLYAAFFHKLKIWKEDYGKVKSEDAALQSAMEPLQNMPSTPQQAAPLLEKPAELLDSLSSSARQLHVDFQVMANILEIFQQIPAALVTSPPHRIFGETWLQHEERTQGWGIADPVHPTANFSAHSIYAIRDHNRAHVVWADEANILDFLLGRVKGQDYAYKNSADVPYCMRCHNRRVGKHNFTWCRPTNSQTMIDACNVLEKTAH